MTSIKQSVEKCIMKGMTDEEAWKAVREQYYPLRIVGWNYVQKLARDYRRAQSDDASRKREG